MCYWIPVVFMALCGCTGADNSYEPSDWTLSTDDFVPNHYQSSPYVANGYFGQRLPVEGVGYWVYRDNSTGGYLLDSWPLDQPRATFGTISGFWDVQQNITHAILPDNLKRGGESVISGIPDWTGLTVTTSGGESYQAGVSTSAVTSFHQSMSIRNGIVQTNVTWSPTVGAARYQLNYTVLAHRDRLNLGIVRLDIAVDQDTSFKITDILDGAGAVRADFYNKSLQGNATIWTSVSPWGIDYCQAHVVSAVKFECLNGDELARASDSRHDGSEYPWVSRNASTIAQSWDWSLKQGEIMTVYKFVGIASTTSFPEQTLSVAQAAAVTARDTAWDQIIFEHTRKWDAAWDDADILIPDDEELQTRTRASIFHILTNLLPEDAGLSQNSISVGGLSSDSYAGLIFWDADTWIYPPLLALHPQYATTINGYRQRMLNQATQNALLYNYSGALYPWTSGRFGNCTGTGVCKGYQYHLNTDIALSHWQYFLHTNDRTWLAGKGWPVIKSVADMFAAYVSHNATSGKYETIQLAEPDEFAYNIKNGAFTNAAIKQLLGNWAPAAAKELGLDVPTNWSDIARNMYIPFNQEDQIIIEFDGMDGTWEVKQASVGLINYPLGFQLSETQARNDVAYYSSVNTEDGPAMTWSIYAISEAQLQQKGCAAYTYLQRSSESYIRQPFYQFSETMMDTQLPGVDNPAFIFGLNPAFPFLTGAGGFLQVFTHGFTGMRPSQDAFYLDPTLPPQLPSGIRIKGMKWQGAVFDVFIESENTTVTRQPDASSSSGSQPYTAVKITVGIPETKEYLLSVGESIVVPTRRPHFDPADKDVALCRKVTSENSWAPGNYPYSIVDGSNSTVWQPISPEEASATIDLGTPRMVSKITINWAGVPPSTFSVWGKRNGCTDFEQLSADQRVQISAPYNPEEARRVRIRSGNTTEVILPQTTQVRFLQLTIEGSHVADGLGATVAAVRIEGM
ncbi:glycoside hydrolase family 65 protein [Thozetella sp. PMI_491]|nr:glycoside hydrolase family 65 protein [Thozetella sp. PMI_491]